MFVVLLLDEIPEPSLPSMATALYVVPTAKRFYDVFPYRHFLVTEAERGAVAGHRCAQILNQYILSCFLIGLFLVVVLLVPG